jgi:hypothetical protein
MHFAEAVGALETQLQANQRSRHTGQFVPAGYRHAQGLARA